MESNEEKSIWFPAKRYGWGWGLPCAWQGWVVLIVWMILLVAGTGFLAFDENGFFLGYTAVLTAGLLVVCWIKGEKPRWRWGGDK